MYSLAVQNQHEIKTVVLAFLVNPLTTYGL